MTLHFKNKETKVHSREAGKPGLNPKPSDSKPVLRSSGHPCSHWRPRRMNPGFTIIPVLLARTEETREVGRPGFHSQPRLIQLWSNALSVASFARCRGQYLPPVPYYQASWDQQKRAFCTGRRIVAMPSVPVEPDLCILSWWYQELKWVSCTS